MKTFIKVTKALSDPNRVRILKMLETRDLCVCEIQATLKLAQSTTSKHMKLLEDAEFVTSSKQGAWVIYQLNRQSDCPYVSVLLPHLETWLNDDEVLQQQLLILPTITRLPK